MALGRKDLLVLPDLSFFIIVAAFVIDYETTREDFYNPAEYQQ